MRNDKLSTDNIPTELYNKGWPPLINILHTLIIGIWTEEKAPTDWTTNIVLIYKKRGNKLQGHNCREISLLCTEYKILTTVINKLLNFLIYF
jgi:hypothetical protein